ncbi:MAG: amino acid ABC transporter substrate-binding protein [Candidatus Latescibacteria bacterium]|nr:amino acid ABC transporter substrate-binding protein [Candidatus Latescibacterota bacterium]
MTAERTLVLALALALGVHDPGTAAGQSERRYPPGKAAELKARLLDRPDAAEAATWAAQYVVQPELYRLEPMTRTAEQIWAARLGLASGTGGGERKSLRAALQSLEKCPLDSLAYRRAQSGISRIGVVVPLTGRFERYGKTFVQGLRLAVDEHNRDWAPTINLVLHDSEGDPLVGARKARWLLRDHGVSVIIGELFSANTAPLAAATQVVGAVLVSPSATNERLAILGDAVFQLHVGYGVLAQALAEWVAEGSAQASVALLVSDSPEDSSRADAVRAACRAAGVDVVGSERVREGAVDFTKPLTALREKRPGALVLLTSPRLAGIAAAQLGSAWPNARVLGLDALDPEGMSAEARSALEGATYFTSDYTIEGAPRDSFETRYQRTYREAPTRMSVRGYLVGLAVARGIERGSLNASMLREALRAQLYETEEGRALRALRPLVKAEPERFVIRAGKATPAGGAAVSP